MAIKTAIRCLPNKKTVHGVKKKIDPVLVRVKFPKKCACGQR